MEMSFKKQRRTKKILLLMLAMGVLFVVIFLFSHRKVIFQVGNPIPYFISAMSLNDEVKFVEIDENAGIYISERGECPEFIEFIEKTYQAEFVEQMGSAFIFTNKNENFIVNAEIYLTYFTIWSLINENTQTNTV